MWNHNVHYHDYLLHQFPRKVNRALDIGCGLGFFAGKLAERARTVDAIDIDASILKKASDHNNASNIDYQHADFLEADLTEESYDVITSIASIHHMDLEAALTKITLLLRPSGKLLILGLYREQSILDYMYSVASIPLNRMYLIWHCASITASPPVAPTRPAQMSLKQIKSVAQTLIPDFHLQRHLFWRYSLIWQKQ